MASPTSQRCAENRPLTLQIPLLLVKTVAKCISKFEVAGLDQFPTCRPAIVVGNHLSGYDAICYGRMLFNMGITPRFLAKHTLFQVPILGWAIKRLGTIPVKRDSEEAKQAITAASEILASGKVVAMFPEGTYSTDPDFWPMAGKTGAVRLALKTGVPIVPVACWGTHLVWPQETIFPRIFPRKTVRMRIGEPFLVVCEPGEDEQATIRRNTAEMMRRLTSLVAALRMEAGERIPGGEKPGIEDRLGRLEEL